MTQPSIFDRLRSMQTEGLPLHTLIVEACEVGNELAEALQQFVNGVRTHMIDSPADDVLANVTARAERALSTAYPDNGNGSNGSNRSAA